MFALVEAGGTKFAVAIAADERTILDEVRVPTGAPGPTLSAAVSWLQDAATRYGAIEAIGVASFGPIETDTQAPDWGKILNTPKEGWRGADIVGAFRSAFGVPVGFETDVNAAALAEWRWGAAHGERIAVYLTIGTGIGGGAVIDGRPVHGLAHPEMGHMRVPRAHGDEDFAGVCPFHGDCLEGLASGPAIERRWGQSLSHLPPEHPAHEIAATYLAHVCTTLQAVLEPGAIVLGGGVMNTPGMIERILRRCVEQQRSYFRGDPRSVIRLAGLAPRSGILGALALAQAALRDWR
jgi:fructokinase